MYCFLELFLCTHVTKSVDFIDELWYRKGSYVHYEREVILEDKAPPPRECLWTPTMSMPPGSHQVLGRTCRRWVRDIGAGRTRWRSAENIGVGSYKLASHTRLGDPSWGVSCSRWLSTMGITLSSLFRAFPVFLLRSFVYAHIHRQRQGEGRGSRWGGLPTFAEVVLVSVLVDLAFGVVFAVFGIRSHSCSCLLAVDGQVVGTHCVGRCVQAIFTAFTILVALTDLGDVVVAQLAG